MKSFVAFCLFVEVAYACIAIPPLPGAAPPPPPPPPPAPCCCAAAAPACAPPPPPCGCGCGGRKKRSILESEQPTTLSLDEVALVASTEDQLCNSLTLKKILKENMSNSPSFSKVAISNILADRNTTFSVICGAGELEFAIGHAFDHCSLSQDGVACQIFTE
ncbi:unnamed protein product, partial [Mesorhabditis spiculigera]